MDCKVVRFSGWAACQKLLSKAVGFIIIKKGTTFTAAEFLSLAKYHTLIADKAAGEKALPLAMKIYEKTTEDIEIQTSNLGIKDKNSDPVPSMLAYIKASAADYDTLWQIEGNTVEIVIILQDGTFWGYKNSEGIISGMKAMIALKADLSPADNAQNSFPVYVFFQNVDEFKARYLASPSFNLSDLQNYIPAGLSLDCSAYVAGDVTATIKTRGTNTGMLGLVVADFEILETNAPDVEVTAVVEVGNGVYTLTVEKNAGTVPANLAAGEFAVIRAIQDDATYYTYLSNAERIDA